MQPATHSQAAEAVFLLPMSLIHQRLRAALTHQQAGRLAQAAAIYEGILHEDPNHPGANHLLGLIAHQLRDPKRAESLIRRAIERSPAEPPFYNSLGEALRAQFRRQEAVACYRTAIRLKPDYIPALNNLSVTLLELADASGAAEAAQHVLRLDPRNVKAHNRLGVALNSLHHFAEAAAVLQAAVRLQPDYPNAYVNLGNAYSGLGDAEAAVASYREALRLKPTHSDVHSNLLFAINYLPHITPQQMIEEHRKFEIQHAAPLRATHRPHENDRNPDRTLRVGYVSPDFLSHPIAYFIEPILRHHDPARVEAICYSNVSLPDETTQRIRSQVPPSNWQEIYGMPADDVAELVRRDRIDILVDLAEHTTDNRLLVFARRPAPVQATYLGYPQTTGLSAIDYKISQTLLDPPGQTEAFHSERIVRLPDTYFCYGPHPDTPPIGPGPSDDVPITFLSVNGMLKVNADVLAVWARLLQRVPGSRLLLKGKGLETEAGRQRMASLCRAAGINADRFELHSPGPFIDFMNFFDRGHIALDPFPYNGGTTTCHTLYMGVPVITLTGPTALHRMGESVLTAIDLPDLVARSPDQYIDLAARLAEDPPRLRELRSTLRHRMEQSPVMDAGTFTRHLESLYRQMWRDWCARPS